MDIEGLRSATRLVRGKPCGADAAAWLDMMADVLPIHVFPSGIDVPSLNVQDVAVYTGDVNVSGLIDGPPETHGTMLVVIGNLTAVDLVFEGPMVVTGDLTVSRAVFLHSTGDWGLRVGGTLRAPLLIESDHTIEAGGGLACEKTYRHGNAPREMFADFVLTEAAGIWSIEAKAMARAIREGRSVLRP